MAIEVLQVTNFRNLTSVKLQPIDSGLNIISGLNGSGKTSLLEAMYYLSHGRSFRTASPTKLINHQEQKFVLFAQIKGNGNISIPVAVERAHNGETKLRFANKDATTIMEIAPYLPIRLINSQSYFLFESGPQYRRKYLDWGLFYQNENFFHSWRYFQRALKQRNALLKEGGSRNELEAWTAEFIKYGLELDKHRRQYVEALTPLLQSTVFALLGIENLNINYYSGWDESLELAEALSQNHAEERRFGYTQYGPHRAELDITIDAIPVKHYLSRGQQKLLICAMIVAQGTFLAAETNKELIYLIDDLPAELDIHSRQKLLDLLSKQNTQVFITAIDSDIMNELGTKHLDVSQKLFHVEHGTLKDSCLGSE